MTRGRLAMLVTVLAVAVVATWGQDWLSGRVDDAVLGTATVTATGSQAAPGGVALALAVLAAAVAAMVTGARVRTAALVVGVLLALGAAALALRALASPEEILGPIAASAVGRADTLPVAAEVTPWAHAGTASAILLAVAALLALRGSRRWPDPSSRYDREQAAPSGRRGEVVSSDWEDLSAGVDPTDVPAEDRT